MVEASTTYFYNDQINIEYEPLVVYYVRIFENANVMILFYCFKWYFININKKRCMLVALCLLFTTLNNQ